MPKINWSILRDSRMVVLSLDGRKVQIIILYENVRDTSHEVPIRMLYCAH